jgi:hypothetical protein
MLIHLPGSISVEVAGRRRWGQTDSDALPMPQESA